jgi:hypothetical protein
MLKPGLRKQVESLAAQKKIDIDDDGYIAPSAEYVRQLLDAVERRFRDLVERTKTPRLPPAPAAVIQD